MELVSLGKEVLQNLAEKAASYRLGQNVLRQLDRGLWVVEKCARWAVPPPLDQDERPPSELVRPLPWVFFLAMLIALRITRESISLLNLVMGKPPLRSADVVMYIQSKRRYLRTLKYQGSRMMRARSTAAAPRVSWYTSLVSLFELTMCFRNQSNNYGNNNTTRVSNNDEVIVVKRNKHGQPEASPAAAPGETTMERLLEKMMLDLGAASDEDSTYTLTNITSQKSDRSDLTLDSDQDTLQDTETSKQNGDVSHEDVFSLTENISTSTPEKKNNQENGADQYHDNDSMKEHNAQNNGNGMQNHDHEDSLNNDDSNLNESRNSEKSPKQETENLIQSERAPESPRKEKKIANGRTVKSVPNKKKGAYKERHHSNEVLQPRGLQSNNSF